MLLGIWIRNGRRGIAGGKRLLDRAVESGLAVPRFLIDGVLAIASVHFVTHPVIVAYTPTSFPARPSDRQEKRACVEPLDAMRHSVIDREQSDAELSKRAASEDERSRGRPVAPRCYAADTASR
jgi:hypothetical protein